MEDEPACPHAIDFCARAIRAPDAVHPESRDRIALAHDPQRVCRLRRTLETQALRVELALLPVELRLFGPDERAGVVREARCGVQEIPRIWATAPPDLKGCRSRAQVVR